MKHYIVWHDNGVKERTLETSGYSEEITDKTADEIRAEYQSFGCRVFVIDEVS